MHQPGHFIDHRRRAADADYVAIGFGFVATAVSFLLFVLVGHDAAAGATLAADTAWQVILAYATMAAGLLFIAHGMRVRDARPPAIARRALDAAVVALGHAGGPERLLLVVIILICPFLEAWFDFI
ncbi:hypothetical protein QOZ80_4BG0334680 [Eleusine coracana subsp. coracana]|nr:hypothetical protein QOZ80_4BG0334680 [Eleusine coracana subsp. coracana]